MSTLNKTQGHHWKQIASCKNLTQKTFQQTAEKRRFTPLKDNSIKDSKIFQRFRQRSNSSFAGLNKIREINTVSIKCKKQQRKNDYMHSRPLHPQNSALVSTLKNSQFRQFNSTVNVRNSNHSSSGINKVVQLQKQFKLFKDKVMKLIQRQQQQINRLSKEMVVSFQFELRKLEDQKKVKCFDCQLQSDAQKPKYSQSNKKQLIQQKQKKVDPKIRQVEGIKQELNRKLQMTSKYKKNKDQQQLSKSTSRKLPALDFKYIQSRFDSFFDIFNQLKSDICQMQQISSNKLFVKQTALPPIKNTATFLKIHQKK